MLGPTTTCSSTTPEQRLKARGKTPAGGRQAGCLSPSALLAQALQKNILAALQQSLPESFDSAHHADHSNHSERSQHSDVQ